MQRLKHEEKYLDVNECPDRQPVQIPDYWCNVTKPRRITYQPIQSIQDSLNFRKQAVWQSIQ